MIRPFDMNTGSYYAAIASPRWLDDVRPAVIERDGKKCRFCGCTENLQVHHIRYQNDHGENDYFNTKYLVTLCRKCHKIVTNAVEKAKNTKIEVPAFMVKPGGYAQMQIENKVKHAAYLAESELIADTCFEIWKRTLDPDCGRVNLRSLAVLKPIGEIVMQSIEYQAGMTAMGYGAAFAERTITRITNYIAEGYNHYKEQGFSDYDIQGFFKLDSSQMIKVRRNAERLLKNGAGRSG